MLDRGRRTVTDEGRDAIVCIIIDVTESRELHERLRQGVETLKAKNTELETFYQIVFSGFAKLADNPGYSLLYANDQFFQIFGYSPRGSPRTARQSGHAPLSPGQRPRHGRRHPFARRALLGQVPLRHQGRGERVAAHGRLPLRGKL